MVQRIAVALLFFSTLALPSALLAEWDKMNDLQEARRLLKEASELVKDIPEMQQASAAANIAGQQARAADLPAALATVHHLKKSGDQALALGCVVWALDHAGNGGEALRLLENYDLGQDRGNAYHQLALSHLDRNDFKGALQVANLIQERPYLLIDVFIRIAKQKWKSDDLVGAQEAIQEALKAAGNALKEDPNSMLQLVGIASAQAEIGDKAGALATLDRFSELARQGQSTVARDLLLQQLAIGEVGIGDLASAFRMIDELPEGSARDIPLRTIADQQAKDGDFREALYTVSLMSDAQLRALELREIGVHEGTSGKQLEALEAIDNIANAGDRAYALATLALEQAEKGDATAARTLQLTMESAYEADAKVPVYVFEFIAVTRALLKDFPGAQESLEGINDGESRVWPLWNITAMMAEGGDVSGALALATKEKVAYPKAYALLGTAQGILGRLESEAKAKSKSGAP